MTKRGESRQEARRDDGELISPQLISLGHAWGLQPSGVGSTCEIQRWRAYTLKTPPILAVARACRREGVIYPTRVQVGADAVMPRTPVVLPHVHLGPLLTFADLWAGLERALLHRHSLDASDGAPIAAKAEGVPGERPGTPSVLGGGPLPHAGWQDDLELAFAWRAVAGLRQERSAAAPGDLARVVGQLLLQDLHGESARTLLRTALSRTLSAWLRERLLDPKADRTQREVSFLVAAHTAASEPELDPSVGEADVIRATRREATLRVAKKGIVHYERTMTRLWQSLVVQGDRRGLGHFLEVVRRDGPYRRVLEGVPGIDLHAASLKAAVTEPPLAVAAIEVHVSPTKWLDALSRGAQITVASQRVIGAKQDLTAVRRGSLGAGAGSARRSGAAPRDREAPVGWIVGFDRAPAPEHLPDPARVLGAGTLPTPKQERERRLIPEWRQVARNAMRLAVTIADLLTARPLLLRSLCGVGLMGKERFGALWLFRDAIELIRDRSRRVASAHAGADLRPLGVTLHLGEDWEHPLTGLRAIDEAIQWGTLSRGDRIGHATVLGIELRNWSPPAGRCCTSAWEHILDIGYLATLAVLHKSGDGSPMPPEISLTGAAFERMRASVADAFEQTFGPVTTDPLLLARRCWSKLRDARPAARSAPPAARNKEQEAGELVRRMLDERHTRIRGLTHQFDVTDVVDAETLVRVQEAVRRRVAEHTVAIEVNPSSNLLVEGFKSMFEQPTFHRSTLPLLFSTDDPLTFGTSLADEYAYAWAGMVRGPGKHEPATATRLLERAAEDSVRYRFVGREV